METKDIVLLAVTLLILGEVSYLLAKLPRATMKTKGRAILVDTSVLMDGRITAVAATGFIGGTLVIPRSVVGELQFLADNADSDKRARARAGLDVITQLQALNHVQVELLQDGSRAQEGVDERLLQLAKQYGASICTVDYNLNKVAVVEGVQVLNINELAQSLRMAYLPGEKFLIELTQKGQDSHQAVGHLADGTMVVVEQASSFLGQTVEVEAIRSLQTAAGKMMFARRVNQSVTPRPSRQVHTNSASPARVQKSKPEQSKEQPQRVKTQRPAQPPREQKPHHGHRAKQPRRNDREAALIELVEKQS